MIALTEGKTSNNKKVKSTFYYSFTHNPVSFERISPLFNSKREEVAFFSLCIHIHIYQPRFSRYSRKIKVDWPASLSPPFFFLIIT